MNELFQVNNLINMALKMVRADQTFADNNDDNVEDALKLVNTILQSFNGTGMLIPFWIVNTFTLTPQQRYYTIGELLGASLVTAPFIQIDYVNIIYNQIRWPVLIQNDLAFLGNSISLTAVGRPGWVRIERYDTYSELEFLPPPDFAYVCEIRGKKEKFNVQLEDYIDLPGWYFDFFQLNLARKLNSYFGYGQWDPEQEKEYQEQRIAVTAAAKQDLSIQTKPPIYTGRGVNIYNLGVIVK